MQKIFDQEIRFKDDDGNEFPDWEIKTLGEVATKKSSNIAANKIEDNNGDYIIYGASGILKRVDFYEEERMIISVLLKMEQEWAEFSIARANHLFWERWKS